MSELFEYEKEAILKADTKTTFKIDFVSDGNEASSHYKIDYGEKSLLSNDSEVELGKSDDLWGKKLKIITRVDNVVAKEKNIALNYLINGEAIVEHNTVKGDNKSADIDVVITFKKG